MECQCRYELLLLEKDPTECLYEEQYVCNPQSTWDPFRIYVPNHKSLCPSSRHARKPHLSISYAACLPSHILGQTQVDDVLRHSEIELPHALSIILPRLLLSVGIEALKRSGNSAVHCTLMICFCTGRLETIQYME